MATPVLKEHHEKRHKKSKNKDAGKELRKSEQIEKAAMDQAPLITDRNRSVNNETNLHHHHHAVTASKA
jgi:hypothetical protein